MFKLGLSTANKATVSNIESKTSSQNNLLRTIKKENVQSTVKTSLDNSLQQSNISKVDNFWDRQLFEKADLDNIPGLDYDLGPVVIPSSYSICF